MIGKPSFCLPRRAMEPGELPIARRHSWSALGTVLVAVGLGLMLGGCSSQEAGTDKHPKAQVIPGAEDDLRHIEIISEGYENLGGTDRFSKTRSNDSNLALPASQSRIAFYLGYQHFQVWYRMYFYNDGDVKDFRLQVTSKDYASDSASRALFESHYKDATLATRLKLEKKQGFDDMPDTWRDALWRGNSGNYLLPEAGVPSPASPVFLPVGDYAIRMRLQLQEKNAAAPTLHSSALVPISILGFKVFLGSYLGGIIHGPLNTGEKNVNAIKQTLTVSPNLALEAEGSVNVAAVKAGFQHAAIVYLYGHGYADGMGVEDGKVNVESLQLPATKPRLLFLNNCAGGAEKLSELRAHFSPTICIYWFNEDYTQRDTLVGAADDVGREFFDVLQTGGSLITAYNAAKFKAGIYGANLKADPDSSNPVWQKNLATLLANP